MRSKQPVVTIQDVARAAGVSVTTASRVLNNKDDVAPQTYQKVRRVMQELNYTANLAAKSMRSRTKNVIGLLVPEVTDVYYQEIIKGVAAVIRESGYDLMIYTGERPLVHRQASSEQEHVALLSSGLTDGCIVVTPTAATFPHAVHIVIIDPHNDDTSTPSVIATNRVGALDAMTYLTSLGHHRIGFISGRADTQSAIRRFEGYKDGLAAAGLPFDPDLVQAGDYTRERGQLAARQLLDRLERPTAIFAANDKMAMGVMDIAQERGLRIPQDLSVVGFDNIPEVLQVAPALTTIEQPLQEMGSIATRMLIGIIRGSAPEQTLWKVATRLIIRESCQAVG